MAKTGDPPGCGSGRSRRYEVPAEAARTIAALTVLRDQVIAPILAGVASPRQDQTPGIWTRTTSSDMQTLFDDLGIATGRLVAA